MAELFDLATSAASNTARFPENMQFRNVNDGARELEAMIARTYKDSNGSLAASGSSNAFTVTTNQTLTAYQDRLRISFTANHTITGAPTLNVSGLGARSIVAADGSALISGDIVSGQTVDVVYKESASAFQLMSARAGIPTASSTSLKVGDVVLTLDATPKAGRIRLGESTQSVAKSSYPELDQWASGMSYPWGSTATHFTLPSAAGYFLRFAATSTTIDPSGSRTAGSTQTDGIKTHTHPATSTSSTSITATGNIHAGGTALSVEPGPTGTYYVSSFASISASTSTSTTVSAASDAITETRPKNVAMHADIIASSALANVGVFGVNGVPYTWDTGTTDANPGSGRLRINNATYSSATELYISETGATSEALGAWLATWDDGSLNPNGTIYLLKVGAVGTHAIFNVSGSMTDSGAYQKCTIAHVASSGTFTNGDSIALLWVPRGQKGDTGAQGSDGGIRWTWDTGTTMADPGAGNFRLNNATIGSATAFAISASTGETGNPSAAGWVRTWDDSTTTARRGTLTLRKASGTQNFIILDVTSAITDNSTWLTGSCSVRDSAGSFSASDVVLVSFSPAGDKGLDGAGSGTVTGLTAGAGLSSSGVGSTGGTVSVSGTLTSVEAVNAQTGTSYTVVSGDHAKLVTISNTASVAVTLPQATSSFGAGFFFDLANINSGVVTITPTTSTINGAASLTLNRFLSVRIVSDGTNWHALHGSSLRSNTTTVASATTCDIGATASQRISITGTTTITGFGTVPNQIRFVTFTGALTLTHNATSLILPGGASITTAAGDSFIAVSDASGNWRVIAYTKADGTAVVGGSGGGAPSIPQGRITLSTATPVMTSTTSAATTVFYTPYTGRYVPLYNGSTWTMTDIGGELSQATTDSTKSPAAVAANSNYDLFVWSDSGTYRCTRGPAWSSDTARGTGAGTTELERVNGIWVNKASITNGPAAQRGTYVGTIRSNGSSQIDFIVGGTAAGGTAGLCGVWNAYNRVLLTFTVRDSTSSWSYNSTTTRSMNNSTGNRVSMIRGLDEDRVIAALSMPFSGGASGDYQPGIALDSTSTISQASYGSFGTYIGPAAIVWPTLPGLGWHYLQAVERQLTTASTASGYGVLSSNQVQAFSVSLMA